MRRGGEDGFTLIETLVALTIFVAGYVLLQQSISLAWRGVQIAHSEAGALQVAQSHLAAAGVSEPLQEGTSAGQTPEGYDWTVAVRRRASAEGGRPGAYWVTVQVSWRDGLARRARVVELTTLKLSHAP